MNIISYHFMISYDYVQVVQSATFMSAVSLSRPCLPETYQLQYNRKNSSKWVLLRQAMQ